MAPEPAKQVPRDQIPVVILCGGMGTRLREETEYRPKPMVEIGEQPILWHIMKIYGAYGARRFVLCLGYKGWEIKQYFLRYHEMHRDFTLAMDGGRAAARSTTATATRGLARSRCAETGARDRHRRAALARRATTSTPRPSSSPTATRWRTSTSTRLLDFHRRARAASPP